MEQKVYKVNFLAKLSQEQVVALRRHLREELDLTFEVKPLGSIDIDPCTDLDDHLGNDWF